MISSKTSDSNPSGFSGADRLYENIVDMIGYRPLTLMIYCWKYITPIVCIVSAWFTHSLVTLGKKCSDILVLHQSHNFIYEHQRSLLCVQH